MNFSLFFNTEVYNGFKNVLEGINNFLRCEKTPVWFRGSFNFNWLAEKFQMAGRAVMGREGFLHKKV